MEERRKAERIKIENEITVSVISEVKDIPKEKISYNYSEDISVSGAKIRGNILLPVGTFIKIDFKFKFLDKQITTFGKVIWNKTIIENEHYEAGVEFVATPSEMIQKIDELHFLGIKFCEKQSLA
jgi:c-di-GMP-binding flagellar brake protein YcgR